MLVTVTLNTALDKLYEVERLEPGSVMRVKNVAATPGGKGLNVSKVAALFGEPVMALGFLGGKTGQRIKEMLEGGGITQRFTQTPGETRSCINIRDNTSKQHTELLEPGAPVDQESIRQFLEEYRRALETADAVALSGSLPQGTPEDFYCQLVHLARRQQVPVLLDTSGEPLRQGVQAQPAVIKPNTDELEQLLGKPIQGQQQILQALQTFRRQGTEIAVASLGKDGALAVGAEGAYRAIPPKIQAVNTVGCGDSMLAGLALMQVRHWTLEEGLRQATALAAANALSLGTGTYRPEDYQRLLPQVTVTKVE